MAKASTDIIEAKAKSCFIITPISNDGSITRRKAYGLINSVIKPVLTELNYNVDDPLDITDSGSITTHVIKRLLQVDMVVANLTDLNPNVMYELAIRHAKRLPVVCLVEVGTLLPFDLAAERTIYFTNDMYGTDELKPALKKAIESAELEKNIDNPIYRAVQENIINQLSTTDDTQKYILQTLTLLSKEISELRINKTTADFTGLPTFQTIPKRIVSMELTIIERGKKDDQILRELRDVFIKLDAEIATLRIQDELVFITVVTKNSFPAEKTTSLLSQVGYKLSKSELKYSN